MFGNRFVYWRIRKKIIFLSLTSLVFPPSLLASPVAVDALFKDSDRLSPDTLVSLVLQRNPDLQVSEFEFQASRERVGYVGALDDPVVKYSVAPRTLTDSDLDGRHTIALSQRLPWYGKRQLQQDRARYQANASQENIVLSQLALTEQARIAFSQWYFVHSALSINDHNQSLVDEFKQIAEIKFSAGKVSKQDVLQAELEILLLQQQHIHLVRERQTIQSLLNQLLSRPANAFIPEPDTVAIETPATHVNIDLEKILAEHPKMRLLEQRIAAEDANVQLADKASYPDFTVTALYNGVMDPAEKRLQVGVALNIPFGNKLKAKQGEARARLKQWQWQQQSVKNTLQSQLQQILDQLRESQQLLQLYKDHLLPLANENVRTAKQDYETGRGDFLSLITAEKNLSTTLLAQQRILTEYYQRRAQLDRVIGDTLDAMHVARSNDNIISSIYEMGDN